MLQTIRNFTINLVIRFLRLRQPWHSCVHIMRFPWVLLSVYSCFSLFKVNIRRSLLSKFYVYHSLLFHNFRIEEEKLFTFPEVSSSLVVSKWSLGLKSAEKNENFPTKSWISICFIRLFVSIRKSWKLNKPRLFCIVVSLMCSGYSFCWFFPPHSVWSCMNCGCY